MSAKKAAAAETRLTRTRADQATPSVTEGRVQTIMAMMRDLSWDRGTSGEALADEWNLSPATVKTMSAEAWRRVCSETDAEKVRMDLGTLLVHDAHRASMAREWGDEARLADVASKVLGARAPEKHQVAVVVTQYDALPRDGKVKWLRERAARMLEEAARLESVVPSEHDAPRPDTR